MQKEHTSKRNLFYEKKISIYLFFKNYFHGYGREFPIFKNYHEKNHYLEILSSTYFHSDYD